MEASVPHVITPQQAAEALGIDTFELAQNCRKAVTDRLGQIGMWVRQGELDLDSFDEHIAGVRRLLESTLACDEAWRAEEKGGD